MITLLNGDSFYKEDILQNMQDDDYYYGFLGENALSSSSIKKLHRSPKAYSRKSSRTSGDSQPFRDGKLIHMHLLEKEKIKDLIVVEGTKARKDFKDAVEEHGPDKVYTSSEVNNAYQIARAVQENDEANFLLAGCDYEVPEIDYYNGLPFRGKADAITKDRKHIVDVKTTSANIEDFKHEAFKYMYHIQAALYLDLFKAEMFTFLVVNKYDKEIAIYECTEEFIRQGHDTLLSAIDIFKEYYCSEDSANKLKNYVVKGYL